MPTYSVAEAKTQLSRLIDEALAGETVTITRHGKPVASITPPAAPRRVSAEMLQRLRHIREAGPRLEGDTVALIRKMREED